MDVVEAAGIAVGLPAGWEGVVYERSVMEISYDAGVPASRQRQPTSRAIAHLANFPLPAERGDYGSGAVDIMESGDVLIVLFEFEPESAGKAMFASEGVPRLVADAFDPNQMQRPEAPRSGVQRFFNIEGRRAFCLYVVIGDHRHRATLAPLAQSVLDATSIAP